jgi:6-pyruvoyltetrahydropterin/6-carboxytetrahydropterin synthase
MNENMIQTVRKRFKVEMAHQLASAYSACCKETIHGHSYLIDVYIMGTTDKQGMVIDFGRLTDIIRPVVDLYDHALLMPSVACVRIAEAELWDRYLSTLRAFNTKMYVVDWNPTAEHMAVALFMEIDRALHNKLPADLLGTVRLLRVRVHETTTGWAQYDGR